MMYPVIIVAAFGASLLTLFSGFGLGTLLMPVIAIFFPVTVAIALTAMVHLLNNLFKLAVLWHSISWRTAFLFGLPAMAAAVPGALILTKISTLPDIHSWQIAGIGGTITPVNLVVGLLLLLFACAEWFSLAKRAQISQRLLPLGGLLSGFFGGLSGHQGAFRSTFLIRSGLDKNSFVATNATIASFVDIARLTVYGLNMSLLIENVRPGLLVAAVAAAFAGVITGRVILKKITIDIIRKLVALMLFVLGILLITGII